MSWKAFALKYQLKHSANIVLLSFIFLTFLFSVMNTYIEKTVEVEVQKILLEVTEAQGTFIFVPDETAADSTKEVQE
jgi:diacylglycerol kinase